MTTHPLVNKLVKLKTSLFTRSTMCDDHDLDIYNEKDSIFLIQNHEKDVFILRGKRYDALTIIDLDLKMSYLPFEDICTNYFFDTNYFFEIIDE